MQNINSRLWDGTGKRGQHATAPPWHESPAQLPPIPARSSHQPGPTTDPTNPTDSTGVNAAHFPKSFDFGADAFFQAQTLCCKALHHLRELGSAEHGSWPSQAFLGRYLFWQSLLQ